MLEEFLELIKNSSAKNAFKAFNLTKLGQKMNDSYPVLFYVVLNSLLILPSTCLCEQELLMLLKMKAQHQSQLNAEQDPSVHLLNTIPQIEKLVYNKQIQSSQFGSIFTAL